MKRLLFGVLCTCALHIMASAHVLDQYLQVAQIALAPDGVRIELRLIPGVQIADRIFALIDVDGDKQISSVEEQAYARRVLQDTALEVDGRRTPLALAGVQFPSRREMNEGLGAIRLTLAAEAGLDATGEHQLAFRNDHLPELGVYLANPLVPTTDAIKITGQQRDELQYRLQVNFQVLSADGRAWPRWAGVLLLGLCLALLLPLWKRLRSFLQRFEDEQINAKKTFS
jgi:nickel/cobalt transporter (NicO) family protein